VNAQVLVDSSLHHRQKFGHDAGWCVAGEVGGIACWTPE
jgi:hypothetical protein